MKALKNSYSNLMICQVDCSYKYLNLFVKKLLMIVLFLNLFITFIYSNPINLILECTEENPCDFMLTKIECLQENTYLVCFEAVNQPGNHEFIIYDELTDTELCRSTLGEYKFCCNITNSTYIKVVHINTTLLYSCQKILYYDFECDYNCNSLNFNSTIVYDDPCFTADLSINTTHLTNITWNFGDGSNSIMSTSNTIRHRFPDAGTYIVCVTFFNIFTEYTYTCCDTVTYVSSCADSLLTWEECPDQSPAGFSNNYPECCIKLTYENNCAEPDFVWSFGDGSAMETTSVPYVNHRFTDIGPYEICVRFKINGVLDSCCFTRYFPPCECCTTADFVIDFLDDFTSCIRRPVVVVPECTLSGFVQHEWIFQDGYVYHGLYPPPHYFTNFVNLSGQVCVTHRVICDTYVLEETKCLPFNNGVYVGSPNTTTKMSDYLPSYTTNVYGFITNFANEPGAPLTIEGTLLVDLETSFVGGIWNMAKGAIIYVDQHQFDLDQTIIQNAIRVGYVSCCVLGRWQGIQSKLGSRLTWNEARITDAQIMLQFIGGTTRGTEVNFTNCRFHENVYGLYSVAHRFIVGNFYDNEFKGCLDCGAVCGCEPGIGIYLKDIPTTGITFPNNGSANSIFSYTEGIHSINTHLNCYNFNFYEIETNGIYFEKNNPFNRHLTIDFLSFDDLETAVNINISNGGQHRLTAIASNPYQSIVTSDIRKGYDITVNGSNLIGSIQVNEINTLGGTDSNFGVGCNLFSTSNNTLNVLNNHININGGTPESIGIFGTSDFDLSQNGNFNDNTIVNNATTVGAGISLTNWKDSEVKNNIITTNVPKNGIELRGSGRSLLQCNVVNYGANGIDIFTSEDNKVISNTLNYQVHSFFLDGNSFLLGSFIAKNTFNQSINESLYYGESAQAGPQEHSEYNRFTAQNNPFEARDLNTFMAPFDHYYAPQGTCPVTSYFPNGFPTNFFVASGSQTIPQYDCISTPQGSQLSLYQSGSWYNDFIQDTSSMSNYSEAERQATKKKIFYYATQNPDWLTNFSGIDSFYNIHLYDNIGQSVNISNGFIALGDQISEQKNTLESELSDIDTLEFELVDVLDQISDETDPGNLTALMAIRDSIQEQIDSLVYIIDSVQAVFNIQNDQVIDTLEQMNDTLEASASYELNEKFINGIRIKLLRGDTLTSTEKDTIREIAMLCFSQAGIAIKEAASIALGILEEYYSQYGCIDEEYIVNPPTNLASGSRVILLPNPVSEELKILPLFTEDLSLENFEIQVINNCGKVLRIERNQNLGQYKLNTSSYSDGLYYLVLKSKDFISTQKFIVVH